MDDIGDYLNLKKMMMAIVILNLLVVEENTKNLPQALTKESNSIKEEEDEIWENINTDKQWNFQFCGDRTVWKQSAQEVIDILINWKKHLKSLRKGHNQPYWKSWNLTKPILVWKCFGRSDS